MKFRQVYIVMMFALWGGSLQPSFCKPLKPKPSRPPAAKSAPKGKTVMVHQEADELQYDDKTKLVHFNGHVKLWQGDTYLEGDKAVYNMNNQQVEASGHLLMKNPQGVVTGNHLLLFYDQKHAVVDGNVNLLTQVENKAEQEPRQKAKKEPLNMTSDQLDYNWKNRIISGTGHVVLIQPDRKAYGEHIVYDEPAAHMVMDGHVHLFRAKQDELICDHLDYDLKTNHAIAQGHVKGNFLVREESEIPAVSTPTVKSQEKSAEKQPPPANSSNALTPIITPPGTDPSPTPSRSLLPILTPSAAASPSTSNTLKTSTTPASGPEKLQSVAPPCSGTPPTATPPSNPCPSVSP